MKSALTAIGAKPAEFLPEQVHDQVDAADVVALALAPAEVTGSAPMIRRNAPTWLPRRSTRLGRSWLRPSSIRMNPRCPGK